MEGQSYNSTHPPGHTGHVTGSLHFFKWYLNSHPGHWQHLQSESLPLTAGQIELILVQNGQPGFENKITAY